MAVFCCYSGLSSVSKRYVDDDEDDDEYEPRNRSRSSNGGGLGGISDKGAIGASSAYDSHDEAVQATKCVMTGRRFRQVALSCSVGVRFLCRRRSFGSQ